MRRARWCLFPSILMLVPLSWLLITSATASPILSLQLGATNDVAFGGGFQVSGSACDNTCIAYNEASSSACSCPASAPLPAFFEAAVDCHSPFASSQAFLCFPGASPLDGVGLGGFYQVDDVSNACRAPNIFTMACSCPATYTTWDARVLAIDNGALLGTTLKACLGPAVTFDSFRSSATSFGGLYQLDDPTPGGEGCRSPNVATGSCTCPEGSSVLTSWRVLVDIAGGGYIGSHIGVCGLAAAPPQPVQICSGQTADPSGASDASAAIQACIDNTPEGATFALPPGVYSISNQVKILKAITLTSTAGATPQRGRGNNAGSFDDFGFTDIFSDVFGGRSGAAGRGTDAPSGGATAQATTSSSPVRAARACRKLGRCSMSLTLASFFPPVSLRFLAEFRAFIPALAPVDLGHAPA